MTYLGAVDVVLVALLPIEVPKRVVVASLDDERVVNNAADGTICRLRRVIF